MIKKNVRYTCNYYSVGYFVFAESLNTGLIEPLIEVDNEMQGKEFISWFSKNSFVMHQILNTANDNYGMI